MHEKKMKNNARHIIVLLFIIHWNMVKNIMNFGEN